VPMKNLCLSPQCGFSSTHHGNNLIEAQEVAKLRLCIDTAREVWGSLAACGRGVTRSAAAAGRISPALRAREFPRSRRR
jgi:hypothetical protein